MKNLYYIPIEPLVERYTEQWYKYFPIEFNNAGFNTITIDGETLTDVVETGTFLDINSSAYYKSEQLKKVSKLFYEKKIKNGDIFFIGDIEFNGLELIRYLADLQNIKVKIYGFLHAASYTKEDFMEKAAPYGKYAELTWIKSCDKVFVGSEYHKRAVIERRIYPFSAKDDIIELCDKIVVTGNPLFKEAYALDSIPKKKNQIIISNRFDWEKRPNLSLSFAYLMKKLDPSVNIVISTSRPIFRSNKQWLIDYALNLEKDGIVEIKSGLSKLEYHTLLAESKVMLTNSIEENFGYCIAEALYYNTYPLCPNSCSHPELTTNDSRLLFNDEDEILDKMQYLLKSDFKVSDYISSYYFSISKMIQEMT